MRLKTFRAFTLAEALDAVHDDLGEDAAILHTRTFKRGGLLGIGGREVVEVIASEHRPETTVLTSGGISPTIEPAAADDTSSETRTQAMAGAGMPSRARRAYAAAHAADAVSASPADAAHEVRDVSVSPDPSEVTAPPANGAANGAADETAVSSGSLEVDRERTRKLAQAMAIRLERQQAARTAAGVQGPDDLVGDDVEGVTATPAPAAGPTQTTAQTTAQTETPAPARSQTQTQTPAPAQTPARTPTADRPERFVIGPDGELIPDTPSSEPSAAAASVQDEVVAPSAERAPERAPERALDQAFDGAAESPKASTETSELEAIRRTVGEILGGGGSLDRGTAPTEGDGVDPLARAYADLVAQELSRDLADRVVASLESTLTVEDRGNPAVVREALLLELGRLVPTEESIEPSRPRDGRPRTIVFVGPTGVGKTTTLAKIAATLVLRDKLSVALVTADTYRISAVDQLRTYAEILGARLEVAADPEAMREAVDRCGEFDAVLVDTPGRSQNDADRLADLRAIVDAARPHETHLVLSGTASERVLLREAEAFGGLGPDRVVLTKLDEAVAFGMLVSVVRRIGRRISWVTTGQEVPRDIERATGSRLAGLVLGGAVKA